MRINSRCLKRIVGIASFVFGQILLAAAVSNAQINPETRSAGNDQLSDSVADAAVVTRADNRSADQRLEALPRNVQRQYQNMLLPAINNEDEESFLSIMSRLVTRESSATIDELEAIAAATGLGSLRSRFTKLLIGAVEQGTQIVPATIKPSLREYATVGMLERVEKELAELDQFELMQDPIELPDGWRDTEQQFWEVHVWKNRFLNMERIVGYAMKMQQLQLKQAIKKKDQAAIDKLQGPFLMAQRVGDRFQELSEREAELRILDLIRAEEILRVKPDFEQELNAAFALQMNAAELDLFFAAHPPGQLGREVLNDADAVSNYRQLLDSGRKSGGATLEKALLLRAGAHWWLRGRYGAGALSDGLLKPPMAMKISSLMEGLYMPKKRPRAVGDFNPETGTYSPGYDRRHFYTWAIEQRNLQASSSSASKSNTQTKQLGEDSAQLFF